MTKWLSKENLQQLDTHSQMGPGSSHTEEGGRKRLVGIWFSLQGNQFIRPFAGVSSLCPLAGRCPSCAQIFRQWREYVYQQKPPREWMFDLGKKNPHIGSIWGFYPCDWQIYLYINGWVCLGSNLSNPRYPDPSKLVILRTLTLRFSGSNPPNDP